MRAAAVALLWLACAQGVAAAGQAAPETGGRRAIAAMRLADGESIALDGRLDEAVWSRAVPGGDFVQIDPDNGTPATERTDVRIAFDANSLYIGVTCYETDPDGIIAYQRRRDEFLQSDDKFQWTIDMFLDARSGYFFEMNPLGAMADTLMGVNGHNRACHLSSASRTTSSTTPRAQSSAGSRASAGSCHPATTSTWSTRTTGARICSKTASAPSTGALRPRCCIPTASSVWAVPELRLGNPLARVPRVNARGRCVVYRKK